MKICVFTSTRADFGILLPLLNELRSRAKDELRLFVTGTHLIAEHGMTYKEIEIAGFRAHYRVPIEMNESEVSHMSSFANAVSAFIEGIKNDPPDIAVVLGDRYETLAFSLVVNAAGIPICHLHGGEVTEGALDDGYRHCITKLSYLHFTVSEKCRSRVISMGENPKRVFNVGALAMDNVKAMKLMSFEELQHSFGRKFAKKIILMTYHPETMSPEIDRVQLPALLSVISEQLKTGNYSLVMTRSNADQGNSWIHEQMQKFSEDHSENTLYVASMGNIKFLSVLSLAEMMVGNSSSGIFEAPAFGTPTINLGHRQTGRERAETVIDVAVTNENLESEIQKAFSKALEIRKQLNGKNVSIFGRGDSAAKMCDEISKVRFVKFMKKDFYEKLA